MNKRLMYIIIGVVVVVAVVIGGYFVINGNYTNNSSSTSGSNSNEVSAGLVTISQDAFKPSTITINKGDTVTWQNNDSINHTVVANDGSFDLGTLSGGTTAQHVFSEAGTFEYHCSIHTFMKGTVIVK